MSPTLGSYILIKNEAKFIAAHLLMWLPHLDQMVFLDGNSTDGTLDIIEEIRDNDENGHKIILVRGQDPKDLQDDYVRLFNASLLKLNTDLAFFLHPDMVPSVVPGDFIKLDGAVAASVKMRSFAGEPDGQLYEMMGRGTNWKSIARLNNPRLGAHYFGHYGVHKEDVYFSAITGDEHEHHGSDFSKYPYEVVDSGLEILHFSDVRTYERRLERMITCLKNQGKHPDKILDFAVNHPRVTLKSGQIFNDSFTLVPAEYPKEFIEARAKYAHLEKTLVKA